MIMNIEKLKGGYTCECCGQFCKLYTRRFNAGMGIALLFLYKVREKGFVHLEKLMRQYGYPRCGDASYVRHYGFIEAMVKDREDGSKRNGHYKITGRGILFVEGKLTASSKFIMFNNKCLGFEGEEINIIQALGTKFDYNTLMNG